MQRILLKLSGESLGEHAFDMVKVEALANEIIRGLRQRKVELAIVIGGGNIWRGRDSTAFGFEPTYSDMIGMEATQLNALVLAGVMRKKGIPVEAYSPLPLSSLVFIHDIEREKAALAAGKVIIFAGGTGNPFFTTDSAAVLRACEIGAEAVLKGTKVEGVFESDPNINPAAKKYDTLTYDEALKANLKIMDTTAFALARERKMPLYIFDSFRDGGIAAVFGGDTVMGTWVK